MKRTIEIMRRIPTLRAVPILCLLAGTAFAPLVATATPITGVLNINGGVTVTATTIDFLPLAGGNGSVAADIFTNTGSFAVLNTGVQADPAVGLIKDLTGGPVVGAISLANFLGSFALAPNIAFDLAFINPGSYTAATCGGVPAIGQVCTPPNSPFSLSNISSGGVLAGVAAIGVAGTVRNTTTGEVSSFTGILSTQKPGTSYQEMLAALAGGGSFSTSYSGSFIVTAIPEPATFGFIGFALLGLGLFQRRRVRS